MSADASPLRTNLRHHRTSRGWSQAHLGALAEITRQSYAAIEAGRSVPSTEVALRLARALGLEVEEIFQLSDREPSGISVLAVGPSPRSGDRVRLARVAGRRVAVSLEAAGASAQILADGVVESVASDGTLRVQPFPVRPPRVDLVVAGCDPAMGLVRELLRQEHGVELLWVPMGSRSALEALAGGTVHLAGVHLPDPEGGEYNDPWVRRLVPRPTTRIHFATWEQCLALAPGNPLGVSGLEDLGRPELRFLNREEGAGARILLEMRLRELGVPLEQVPGFRHTAARGHQAVGEAIAAGAADAGVAIRSICNSRGLDAVTLAWEPYDLVVPDDLLDLPAMELLLSILRRPLLRRQVGALGGYDVTGMGAVR
jgi:putative molybdopterin biosynthesis protein